MLYDNSLKDWVKENTIRAPDICSYCRMFKSTGLKFKQLKSDTCKTCGISANKIDIQNNKDEKQRLKILRDRHKQHAEDVLEQQKFNFD